MAKKRPSRPSRGGTPPSRPPARKAVVDPDPARAHPEHYRFIRAHVNDRGDLDLTYRVNRLSVDGRTSHDEDVSRWTDADIVKLVRQLLDVEKDDPVRIEVERE